MLGEGRDSSHVVAILLHVPSHKVTSSRKLTTPGPDFTDQRSLDTAHRENCPKRQLWLLVFMRISLG